MLFKIKIKIPAQVYTSDDFLKNCGLACVTTLCVLEQNFAITGRCQESSLTFTPKVHKSVLELVPCSIY